MKVDHLIAYSDQPWPQFFTMKAHPFPFIGKPGKCQMSTEASNFFFFFVAIEALDIIVTHCFQ